MPTTMPKVSIYMDRKLLRYNRHMFFWWAGRSDNRVRVRGRHIGVKGMRETIEMPELI